VAKNVLSTLRYTFLLAVAVVVHDATSFIVATRPISSLPLRRDLAIGDFDQWNQLFRNATIPLPDTELGDDGANLIIRNLRWKELIIGDIQTASTSTTTDTVVITLLP
jgi:hypothetical protein